MTGTPADVQYLGTGITDINPRTVLVTCPVQGCEHTVPVSVEHIEPHNPGDSHAWYSDLQHLICHIDTKHPLPGNISAKKWRRNWSREIDEAVACHMAEIDCKKLRSTLLHSAVAIRNAVREIDIALADVAEHWELSGDDLADLGTLIDAILLNTRHIDRIRPNIAPDWARSATREQQ